MKKEDLLKILGDAGLKEEEILALCQEIIEDLGNKEQPQEAIEEQPQQELVESEDDKRKRIFGI